MTVSSLLDVCRFTPTLGGTTDWTYSSAVTGYLSPASAGAVNGSQYSYRAESSDKSEWEVGVGIWNSGVLTRATVLFSSNSNSKVTFTLAPQVAVVALAEDLLPPVAKAYGYWSVTGSTYTLVKAYNVTSLTKNSTGNLTVNLTRPFSSTAFAVQANADSQTFSATSFPGTSSQAQIRITNFSGTASDSGFSFIAFGDQ